MNCEMCGKEATVSTYRVEGTTMSLCKECGRHGEHIQRTKEDFKIRTFKPREEQLQTTQTIATDYKTRIKNARERRGLKQSEMAKELAEKESLLHNIESGHMQPSMKVAKKLEKFLDIQLVETVEEKPVKTAKGKEEKMTLGDFVKVRKRT